MDPVRYRLLGTTQALRPDGSAVPVGGARLRALLTVLALRPGKAVPASLLVDEVWAGDPPADATGALQALVGRLRRTTLGADAITSVESGYRLAAAPDDIDLHRFERLTGRGCGRWPTATPRRRRRSWTTRWPCGTARPWPTSPTAPRRRPAGRPATWTPAAPASPPR